MMRYQRQIALKEFGQTAQQALQQSKVLIVGAGGLGCPVLMYLAAAGVGHLGIVDFDTIEMTNLNRQILFTPQDIGKQKAHTAAEKIKQFNPEITVKSFDLLLRNNEAWQLISDYDVVVDCTDNFTTRYMINDACMLLNKPWVYGAIYQMQGQVGTFNYKPQKLSANYRHYFAKPPQPHTALNCNQIGVLGIMPGIIGLKQAEQTIKICAQLPGILNNCIQYYNSANNFWQLFGIKDLPEIKMPVDKSDFLNCDYASFCNEFYIEQIRFEQINFNTHTIIDIRNANEEPKLNCKHIHIPLSVLEQQMPHHQTKKIVFVCNTGSRSTQAVLIAQHLGYKTISLKNGLLDNPQLTKHENKP
jgi:molybdopterin/thiamine biosynthesis adenylyltransferase/rhodanese-related sulfurtransferase